MAAAWAHPRIQGILCITAGMIVLSLGDSLIKLLSDAYPLHEIVFGRSLIALCLAMLFAHFEGGLRGLRTHRLPLHLCRGLLLVVANMSYFLALAALPLAEAAAIFFVAPLMITALSVPLLGEKVGVRRWIAVGIGMAGVIVMLRPGAEVIEVAALLPVLAAFCYSLMQMITRRLGVTDKASTMAFYIQLTFVFVSAAMGLTVGDGALAGDGHRSVQFLLRAWVWPSPGDALLIAACGCLVGFGAYFLSQAYRLAEANVIAPFEYIALPFAVLWGFIFWNDLPDWVAILGIAMIAGSGLFAFFRESALGRRAASAPSNR